MIDKNYLFPEIKKKPIGIFECEQPIYQEINGLYKTKETIGVYTADIARKTDDLIFQEIQRMIHDEGITTLYVLNQQQVIQALVEYVERRKRHGEWYDTGDGSDHP